MNYILKILLVAAAWPVSSLADLRGMPVPSEKSEATSLRRLTQGTKCTLLHGHILYKKEDRGFSEDEWVCELPNDQVQNLGVQFVTIAEPGDLVKGAVSGISTLVVSESVIDTHRSIMHVPNDATWKLQNFFERDSLHQRHLAAKTGTLRTLVVRVIDAANRAPTPSAGQLASDIFFDNVNLRTQMAACSYNKLVIEPYSGTHVHQGVVEVTINMKAEGSLRGEVSNAAIAATRAKLGTLDDPKFGLIMFCLPPGTVSANWIAYAYTGGKFSFYNNEWCSSVTTQMHEVGHNLGLSHSGQTNEGKYDDQTGLMGYSYNYDDGPRMCFNPAKSFQTGWYSNKARSINPLREQEFHIVKMNGIAEYGKNNDGIVVVRLDQLNREQDYYIGYNRNIGINSDTQEDENKITIVRKESGLPMEGGLSMKVASLAPGQSFFINHFNGQRDVKVTFAGLQDDNSDAIVYISDPFRPPPTQAPTKLPTKPPTKAPTKPPILPPTNVPNKAPQKENSCAKYILKIRTDKYPEDTSWKFVYKNGKHIARKENYEKGGKTYEEKVCLPFNTKIKFVFNDEYGDGLIDNGAFTLTDTRGKKIKTSKNLGEFKKAHKDFNVGSKKQECKDEEKSFVAKKTWGKKSCTWYAKNKKCNAKVKGKRKRVWAMCPTACNQCKV